MRWDYKLTKRHKTQVSYNTRTKGRKVLDFDKPLISFSTKGIDKEIIDVHSFVRYSDLRMIEVVYRNRSASCTCILPNQRFTRCMYCVFVSVSSWRHTSARSLWPPWHYPVSPCFWASQLWISPVKILGISPGRDLLHDYDKLIHRRGLNVVTAN